MKLIMRVDDVGYTPIHNVGSFETLDHGIATSADVMLDTPGTEEALKMLKDRPWISTGWHTHFWGSPVLPAEEVPSLVMADGRFRRDIREAADIAAEEIEKEMRAQMFRCIDILGHVPDVCATLGGDSIFAKAQLGICREFGIAFGFTKQDCMYPEDRDLPWEDQRPSPFGKFPKEPDLGWKGPTVLMTGTSACNALMTDSLTEIDKYDPLGFIVRDGASLLTLPEDAIACMAWHPGNVDYYVLRLGDSGVMAKNFMTSRPIDTYALCAQEAKDFIINNKIELVSFTDALYGTRHFQNHLKAIGSPLAI